MATVTTLPESASREDLWESVYLEYFDALVAVCERKFRIPTMDAEVLVQEVLMSYAMSVGEIGDARAWLIGAACNASRKYWRSQGRLETLPEDYQEMPCPVSADVLDNRVAVREALDQASGKYGEALRLHYLEGCTIEEIAQVLGTTPGYAKKLVRIGLQRAHGG
ncbi:MAG: sigma-70 family RNA polymerase sigma factor [Thermoanaerobaculia bacterium]